MIIFICLQKVNFISTIYKKVLQGPYTSEINTQNATYATDLIEGSTVVLAYFEPYEVKDEGVISISKVVHGYMNMFSGFGSSSADCQIDINCPQGNGWQTASNAVGMILIGSNRICTGAMLNNTSGDFTPYFLTANHCVGGSVSNYSFRFGYKSPTCGGGDDYSFISTHGATLKANTSTTSTGSDAALLELNNRPSGVIYAGWSRSTNAASSGAGIHHPQGDVMKISIENDPIIINPFWSNYWRVNFDDGVVEHRSSGSPFFDQNHRIIGQLYGNLSYQFDVPYCNQTIGDYGRFDVSWTLGNFAPFLDPLNTQEEEIDAILSPSISNEDLVCEAGATFNLQDVPSGASIVWTNSNSNHLTDNGVTNGTSYTVQALPNTQGNDGWVEATINGSIVLRDEFWIGKPLVSIAGSGGVDKYVKNTLNSIDPTYLGSNDQKVTSVTWSYSGTVINAGGNKFSGWFATGSQLGAGSITMTATNDCGTYTTTRHIEVVKEDCSCCGGPPYCARISPNPTNDHFTIDFDKEMLPLHLRNQEIKFVLHNKTMTIKKEFSMQGNSKTIDVRGLPADVYILQVTLANGETFEKKVIVTD